MEGAAAVAVAAGDAGVGLYLQIAVVVRRQGVPGLGQIIILVDEPDVQPGGTGLAVVTVHARPLHLPGGEGADGGVVPLRLRGVEEPQQPREVRLSPDAGEDGEDPRAVQGVLEALVVGESHAEGGGLGVQELPAGVGLHHRDAHPLRLAAAVQGGPLGGAAVGVLPVLVVVSRVDAEHEHIHQAGVQHLVDQLRGVGGKADMAHHPRLFLLQQVVQHSVFPVLLPVGGLVQAVDEAVVDVVGLQLLQLPVHRAADRIQIGGPAVASPLAVDGAEVDLVEDLVPDVGQGLAEGGEVHRLGGGQVKVVDPVLHSQPQRLDPLGLPGGGDGAGPHPQGADTVPRAPVDTIFHDVFPRFSVGLAGQGPCLSL